MIHHNCSGFVWRLLQEGGIDSYTGKFNEAVGTALKRMLDIREEQNPHNRDEASRKKTEWVNCVSNFFACCFSMPVTNCCGATPDVVFAASEHAAAVAEQSSLVGPLPRVMR